MKKLTTVLLALVMLVTGAVALPMTATAAKKTYKNYHAVLEEYKKEAPDRYTVVYYNYLKLKTPYGKQKALVVTTCESAYLERSTVYIKRPNGRAVRFKALKGALIEYTGDKNKFLTYIYVGSGDGNFTFYQYKKSKKNYLPGKSLDFHMDTRDDVYKKVEKLTKDYRDYDYSKYTLWSYGDDEND